MKQTAVEWLYELSKKRELDKFDLEQAKEKEKQQIENAYNVGNPYKTAEQYYNQTFKSE